MIFPPVPAGNIKPLTAYSDPAVCQTIFCRFCHGHTWQSGCQVFSQAGVLSRNLVRVSSRRGTIEAEAMVTDRVPPGMVYANFHFPEAPANELTIAALDPVAKIPEYKVCAVKVEAV